MQYFRDRHRAVGAQITNDEYDAVMARAAADGLRPGQYLARLIRADLANAAAPSMVPEITAAEEVA